MLIAKWLETQPKIFIMDEPTIGIDVGSKFEIRAIIDEIAAAGVGVILISAELIDIETPVRPGAGDVPRRDRRQFAGDAVQREAMLPPASAGDCTHDERSGAHRPVALARLRCGNPTG